MRFYRGIISMCFCGLLLGCATDIEDVRMKNTKTMKEIQDEKFSKDGNYKGKNGVENIRVIKDGTRDLKGYTRSVENETHILFPKLPNPVLVGYVFPHLTKDEIPIPGYSVPFSMSPRDYYEMPE